MNRAILHGRKLQRVRDGLCAALTLELPCLPLQPTPPPCATSSPGKRKRLACVLGGNQVGGGGGGASGYGVYNGSDEHVNGDGPPDEPVYAAIYVKPDDSAANSELGFWDSL